MRVPQSGGPNLSFAGFILLALLGTFVWKSAPLDSARPVGNNEWLDLPDDQALPAKLWQDPFEPILASDEFTHLMGRKSQFEGTPLCQIHDDDGKGVYYQLQDSRRRPLRVLMPMLSQGQDPEKIERRRRRRYAVVAALSEAGYVPRTPDEIQTCLFKKPLRSWSTESTFYVVPYEWYIPEDRSQTKPPVLVLWLNETAFSKNPFGSFSNLVQQVAGPCVSTETRHCSRNVSMFALGPARSSTLIQLAAKASKITMNEHVSSNKSMIERKFAKANINGFHILSPMATVADSEIDRHLEHRKFAALRADFKPSDCYPASSPGPPAAVPCISFLRTIQTDEIIVESLVRELKKRTNSWNNNVDHVALIFERDTSFGRALPRTFSRALCPENADGVCSNIRTFGYFRGVDGFVPGNRTSQVSGKSSPKDETLQGQLSANESFVRPPAGTGQFDYLRRLATDIKEWDMHLRRANEGRIRAIGILGSDVYDKLLVLRALKTGFPHITFFTTDLDAQLSHPSEYQWTRNLIVGSTYGFKLREDLQGTTLPFRDSYQTSLYLATLLATKFNYPDCKIPVEEGGPAMSCASQEDFSNHIPDQVFEIGRFGPVPMPAVMRAEAPAYPSVNPALEHRHFTAVWLKLVAMTALLIFVVHQLRPVAGKLIVGLSIAAAGFFFLLWVAMFDHYRGEPFLLSQGISVWPTEFIRFVVFCLAVFFITRLSKDLHNNYYRLSRDYFGKHCDDKKFANRDKTLRQLWRGLFHGRCQSYLRNNLWIWFCFIPVVIVFRGMPFTMQYHITQPVWVVAYWATALLIWYMGLYHFVRVRSINAWAKRSRDLSASTVRIWVYWESYCELGTLRERSYRSLTLWLLFMSFAALVFVLTGIPDAPTRGAISFYVDKALVILSVSSMLILLFVVLDEFRMCNYWIQGLIGNTFDWKDIKIAGQDYDPKLKDAPGTIELFKIRLIADRTGEIGYLIYYPSLLFIITLLSRHSYFDNWGMPSGIAVVISVSILLLFMAAVKLRRQAEACRKHAIDSLKLKVQGLDKEQAGPINTVIDEIHDIHDGAFLPLREQPLVRASLPLLGAVGLTIGEYMRMLN